MILLDRILLLSVWLGHFALCVALFNRLHAVRISRKLRRVLEVLLLLSLPIDAGYYTWHAIYANFGLAYAIGHPSQAGLFLAFPLLCWSTLVLAIPLWLWPRLKRANPASLRSMKTLAVNVVQETGAIETHGTLTSFLARLPGNEIFQLHLCEKQFEIEDLPAGLNGFSIIHLSDLHFTGDIGQRYFDYVVDAANQMLGDVVIISGDIIESAACEPWIEKTLGRLEARQGKYFVLGNHDLRMPNVTRVRELLTACGFIDLGGKVLLTQWNECGVLLVGDERPWFPGPQEQAITQHANECLFRVLVAHSPDRLPWARTKNFALMLAGHNHGGQVRFPLIGPLISPSLSGTRYASGTFHEKPTLLHVSRGISGEHPLRWNCAPEAAKLVLHRLQ